MASGSNFIWRNRYIIRASRRLADPQPTLVLVRCYANSGQRRARLDCPLSARSGHNYAARSTRVSISLRSIPNSQPENRSACPLWVKSGQTILKFNFVCFGPIANKRGCGRIVRFVPIGGIAPIYSNTSSALPGRVSCVLVWPDFFHSLR